MGHDAKLLSVDDARQRIHSLIDPVKEEEQVKLKDALGRVLAQDITSPFDIPPFRNSAMDGYAVQSADLSKDGDTRLKIIGTSYAGTPLNGDVGPGECARIMTGAVLPDGADTVIMQEHVERTDTMIRVGPGHCKGRNVRHPGEDLTAGTMVLMPGRRLMPGDLGVIASLGIGKIAVKRRLKVAIFSNGDELQAIGKPLNRGQIYDSNRYALQGMLTRLGVDLLDLGVIRDQRKAIEQALHKAAEDADIVITTGGVSVGEADFIKDALENLGNVNFWKIAVKPGKPLAFGTLTNAVFFGLPGNPVSVMATFYQFVQPALRVMAGETGIGSLEIRAVCTTDLKKQPGRTEFQRGLLASAADGNLTVSTTGGQGSHILSSMVHGNCFIILDAECSGVAAGELVTVQPFEGLV